MLVLVENKIFVTSNRAWEVREGEQLISAALEQLRQLGTSSCSDAELVTRCCYELFIICILHRSRPVGSDKYLVFNLHQHPSHRAHAHKLLGCYIEPIRGEIDSVSANNK